MSDQPLPEIAVKKARNLVTDSRLAPVVGLIPILGLVYILRLVQWYLLRSQYPELLAVEDRENASLAADFRSALPRLWFAVLLWPVLIVLMIVYAAATT
jgi:hypothetical protein